MVGDRRRKSSDSAVQFAERDRLVGGDDGHTIRGISESPIQFLRCQTRGCLISHPNQYISPGYYRFAVQRLGGAQRTVLTGIRGDEERGNGMGKRAFAVTAVMGALALTVGACGSSSSSDSSNSSSQATDPGEASLESVTLRVGEVKNGEFQWAADTSEKVADAPYNVEFVSFDSSPDMLAALSAGAIDIAPAVQMPALVAAQGNAKEAWTVENSPLRIVAAWSNPDSPGWVLLSNDSSVDEPAKLSGRKLAYSKGAFGQVFWLNLASDLGLTDVETAQLPYLDALAAFQEGAVDALITSYRFGAAVEANGKGAIIGTSVPYVGYASLTVARSDFLAMPGSEAVIADFLERMNSAYEWAQQNLDVVAQYFVDQLSLTSEVAARVAPTEIKKPLVLGDELVEIMQKVVDALVVGEIIPGTIDPTVPFDRRFE